MAKWFYYNESGDKIEVTGGYLKGLAKAGMITPDTIVENEEGKTAPARKVKGLTFGEATPSEPSQSTATPPISVNWYYYDAKGKKVGLVPFSVLQSLAENGVISPGTAVESENGQAAIAGKIEGLIFAESQSPPEPVPAVPSETFNLSDAFNAAMNATVSGGKVPTNTQFTAKEQEEIKNFLACNGKDVSATDESGRTLLHSAVSQRKSVAVFKYLVSQGADVKAKNNNGHTPLHWEASYGDLEVVKYLVSKGADVNAKDCFDHTPLHEVVTKGHIEVAKYLVSKGADVNAKETTSGFTPLHYAVTPADKVEAATRIELVKFLISKGANVNVKGRLGETPLHRTVERGYIEVVEFLVSQGADVKTQTGFGESPLDLARKLGHTTIVQYLTSLSTTPSAY